MSQGSFCVPPDHAVRIARDNFFCFPGSGYSWSGRDHGKLYFRGGGRLIFERRVQFTFQAGGMPAFPEGGSGVNKADFRVVKNNSCGGRGSIRSFGKGVTCRETAGFLLGDQD